MMLKKLVKNTFHSLGFNISRISETQTRHDKLFPPIRNTMHASLNHLRKLDFYPDIIVDMGAANGTWQLQESFPESRFIWIEPLSEYEDSLKKLSQKYNGEYVIAAAGPENGTSTIRVSPDLFGSTLCYPKDQQKTDDLREIQIIKADNLIDSHNLKGTILLKLDVQGFELEALKGSKQLLTLSSVVIIEVSFINFAEHQPEFYDVIHFMAENDFVVYDMFDGHNRPLDGALIQKDLLFVKKNGQFRQTDQWATSEQVKEYHQLGKRISDN